MTYVLSSKLIKLLGRLFFLTLILSGSHSRLLSKDNITFKFDDLALKPALSKLLEEHGISIIFPDSIPNTLITARCDGCNMDEAVSEVLESVESESLPSISKPLEEPPSEELLDTSSFSIEGSGGFN